MSPVNKEEERIVAVIEAETEAFWNKDFDAWAACWVQDSHVRRWGWAAHLGGITARDGWVKQAERMRQLMADNPVRNPSIEVVRRENLSIRVCGDLAWVTFEQHAPDTGDGMDVPGVSLEMRVMEKHEGAWKIAGLFFVLRSLHHIASPLVRVQADGQITWMNPAAAAALEAGSGLAVRAGRLRAVERTADQRLQAAIDWAAHLDDGLYPARGSLAVVLGGGRGDPANVCWVVADSGIVLVAINDQHMVGEGVAAAALVYGLTEAQLRVARLIIAGNDIVAAARQLGVSVTTARTHLQRMYDKTGVRSQPALVRALLSVTSPPI